MKDRHEIKELIISKIGHTNGWRISDEDYEQLCLEVADEIINSSPSESQSVVDNEVTKDACKHVWPLSPSEDGFYYCTECNHKWHQQAD